MTSLTLSADERVIDEARVYAESRGTTLDLLIQDYLRQLVRQVNRADAADEFADLAKSHQRQADVGWTFDREEIHRRGWWS